jgi:hypothetical protein
MALNSYKILGQVTSGTYEKNPVTDRTLTSNIATITTGVVHNMAVGDRVEVIGTDQSILNFRTVVASVPTTTTFTYPRTNANITTSTQTAAWIYRYSNSLGAAVTNKVKTNGIVTLTTASAHNLKVGDFIAVWINDTNIDGDFVVATVPTTTTFTYVNVGAAVTTAAVTSGAFSAISAQTVYTVPANKSSVVSTLTVSNTLTHSCYFMVHVVKSGDSLTAPTDKTIIGNRIALGSGESYNMTMGYTLGAGESIVVRASHAGMYFNLFGTELS